MVDSRVFSTRLSGEDRKFVERLGEVHGSESAALVVLVRVVRAVSPVNIRKE